MALHRLILSRLAAVKNISYYFFWFSFTEGFFEICVSRWIMLSFIVNLYDRLISMIINFLQNKTISELADGVGFYFLPPVSAHMITVPQSRWQRTFFFILSLLLGHSSGLANGIKLIQKNYGVWD